MSGESNLLNDIESIIQQLQTIKSADISSQLIEKVKTLAEVIGFRFVSDMLRAENAELQKLYRNTEYMQNLEPEFFRKDKNPVLLSFFAFHNTK